MTSYLLWCWWALQPVTQSAAMLVVLAATAIFDIERT